MTEWIPPGDIDPEMVPLCQAINWLPGLQTRFSCFGHGEGPFYVLFTAEAPTALIPILECTREIYPSINYWRIWVELMMVEPYVFYRLTLAPRVSWELSANKLVTRLTQWKNQRGG
jgi:hypothetical protein